MSHKFWNQDVSREQTCLFLIGGSVINEPSFLIREAQIVFIFQEDLRHHETVLPPLAYKEKQTLGSTT